MALRRFAGVVAIVTVSVLAAGCASWSERYYVGVQTKKYGEQLEPTQFYRFDLDGSTMFQRTEFQSGWYDREAVDRLFSEVVTETSLRNNATGGAVAATVATKPLPVLTEPPPGERSYTVLGPEGERLHAYGKRFVIIAANNPKAIANQIDSIANSQEISDAFNALIQREERADALAARVALEEQAAPQRALRAVVDAVLEDLKKLQATPDQLTQVAIRSEIDRIVRALPARKVGP